MTRWKKWLVIGAGILILIPVALYVAVWLVFSAGQRPSNIADFHPTSFRAKAEGKFFYSIGNELKYSDQIDPGAPTLMRGEIRNFLVSPDRAKIAVVANGRLLVVGTDSIPKEIAAVDSIYSEPKPIGKQFIRDDDFQWSRDSKDLYLIRDEYYLSRGSQLHSPKGELWKFDIDTAKLDLVLKPFPAHNYFFGRKSIYFSTPTDQGNLQLRCFDGSGVTDVGDVNAKDIPVDKLSRGFAESPFYSFSIIDYEHGVLPSRGVELVEEGQAGPQRLVIGGKPVLVLTQGIGFKGPYFCSDLLRSAFLPGDRYFLFNVPYCGNYNGELLFDTLTGDYQRLPHDSVVYITLNTETYSHYRVTAGGIVIE